MVQANLRRAEIWVLLVAALTWLDASADGGAIRFFLAIIPGSMMVATVFGTLFAPGDRRIPHIGAVGGLLGLIISVLLIFVAPGNALALAILSLAAIVSCGLLALDDSEIPEGIGKVDRSVRTGAEVGADEVVLGVLMTTMGIFPDGGQSRIAREVDDAIAVYKDKKWDESPTRFHRSPGKLDDHAVQFRKRTVPGWTFEELSFESGYEPWPEMPGRDRYMGYAGCRRSFAWLLRSRPEAPWAICIHGLAMGEPIIDLNFLHTRLLHNELGMNLVFPILPLHGPRRRGLISGRGIATGEVLDTVHAEAQAAWDIRRLLSWIRAQGGEKVAIQGMSLGGYNTALVSCLEGEFGCAIAGIPAPDLASLMWWHAPPAAIAEAERVGLTQTRAAAALAVVSPLAMRSVVPAERRYIYGALADRFIPPAEVLRLAAHWELESVHWYPGSHLSFPFHDSVSDYIASAMKSTVLAADAD